MARRRTKPDAILVFGEDHNDQQALAELMKALRPDAPRIEKRRKPPVLVKDRERAKARRNAIDIARVARASAKRFRVVLVVAHQDCDALEPAHVALSEQITDLLSAEDLPAIAATPAWELEAWFFLWPDAALEVNSKWRRPAKTNQRVGLISNAKEEYRRALRPRGTVPTRDYRESDAPSIARAVRILGLIDQVDARSDSFRSFRRALLRAKLA